MDKEYKKKKHEVFSSLKAKRAEIEEMLAIARKITDAGYGNIWFTLENEETREKGRNEEKNSILY